MVREHGGRVTCGTLETRGEQFLRQVPADAAQTLPAGPRFRAFLLPGRKPGGQRDFGASYDFLAILDLDPGGHKDAGTRVWRVDRPV